MIKTDIKIAGRQLYFSYADNQFYVRRASYKVGYAALVTASGSKLYFQEILNYIETWADCKDWHLKLIVDYSKGKPNLRFGFTCIEAWKELQKTAAAKLNRKSTDPTHPLKGSPNTWDRANDAKQPETITHLGNWSAADAQYVRGYQNYWAPQTWESIRRQTKILSEKHLKELEEQQKIDRTNRPFQRLEYHTHKNDRSWGLFQDHYWSSLDAMPSSFDVNDLWRKRWAKEETRESKIKRLAKMDSNSEEFRKLWKTCL